jgi:hypothetical protein
MKSFKEYLEIINETRERVGQIRKTKEKPSFIPSEDQIKKTSEKLTSEAIKKINSEVNSAYMTFKNTTGKYLKDDQKIDFSSFNELYEENYETSNYDINHYLKNNNIYDFYNEIFNSSESKEELNSRMIAIEILALLNQEFKNRADQKVNISKTIFLKIKNNNIKESIKLLLPKIS